MSQGYYVLQGPTDNELRDEAMVNVCWLVSLERAKRLRLLLESPDPKRD